MAKILTSGSCSSVARPATGGWYNRIGRYGCVISSKPKAARPGSGVASWSIPSPLLGGMTLAHWRRACMATVSRQWANSSNIDHANFSTSYTYTLITGHTQTRNGYDLFAHVANTQWQKANLLRLRQGLAAFVNFPFDLSASYPEPAPPAITAASWDGKDDLVITLSNYQTVDVFDTAFYATTPNRTSFDGKGLFMVAAGTGGAVPGLYDYRPYSHPSSILKPWPPGSECLLGIRVWLFNGNYFLPSPIAAELITVG
jgi:hypothetical protein